MNDEAKTSASTRMTSWGAPLALIALGGFLSIWVRLNPARFGAQPKDSILTGLPLLALLVFAFVRAAVASSGRVSDLLLTWLIAFLMALHTVLLAVSIGLISDLGVWVPIATGILFVGLGPTMAMLEPGSMMGLRVKATLGDPAIWRRTHRFLGAGFAGFGVLGAGLALVDPKPAIAVMAVGPLSWMFLAAARARAEESAARTRPP